MMELGRDFERMRDYVVGRMSDDERRTFEQRLARDPELVRELEQSLRLREGLQILKARGYFEPRVATAPRGARKGARPWSARLLAPALAAAAAAGLALFLWIKPPPASPGLLRASLESGLAGGAASVRAHFTFLAMRAGSSPDLALPSQGLIELRVQPAAHATVSQFRTTLLREQEGAPESSLGTLGGLAPADDGYIHLYMDASRLTSGSYRLRVEGQTGPNGAAEVFSFRLRAGANPAP
ncbi:MAG TPA: hypothetical protein VKQ31_00040 [Steroidobacteraceae bacterium]|nr:hypothetical protein [Steroidobacteraceae bacterium]